MNYIVSVRSTDEKKRKTAIASTALAVERYPVSEFDSMCPSDSLGKSMAVIIGELDKDVVRPRLEQIEQRLVAEIKDTASRMQAGVHTPQ